MPNKIATFMADMAADPANLCFLTDTNYTNGWEKCKMLKLYGNGILTYSTGGMYQFADDITYASGGGGGTGYAHSMGPGLDGVTSDFFVVRGAYGSEAGGVRPAAADIAVGTAFDFYEQKDGRFQFGYYDCDKIVQGGAVDDYANNYFCTGGVDLFRGCLMSCGPQISNWTMYNFTSALFPDNQNADTQTSQLFEWPKTDDAPRAWRGGGPGAGSNKNASRTG